MKKEVIASVVFVVVIVAILIAAFVFVFEKKEVEIDEEKIFFGPGNESVTYDTPVLVLKYFPTQDGINLDGNITGVYGRTIDQMRDYTNMLSNLLVEVLENGSTYHGYKDFAATPALNYSILGEYEFLKPVPLLYTSNTPANHTKILKDEGFDICDYVENQGVKEVWVWMYHSSIVFPVESYQRGPNHQFGNGYMDLPLCNKSYTVYDYNYGRGLSEALEDHTHHIERVIDYIDYIMFSDLFTGGSFEFLGNNKDIFYDNLSAVYRCGWTHCPPNVIISVCSGAENIALNRCTCGGYDWFNEREVLSDCEDWKPDGSGEKKLVSCHTWSNSTDCRSSDPYKDGDVGFKIWWMQNIPGKNNSLTYQTEKMRNWWEFVGDFDNAIARGRSFVDEPVIPPENNTASFGKNYTLSVSPTGLYQDEGNSQLTNGQPNDDLYLGRTEATVGWLMIDPNVTIDLMNLYNIYKVKGHFGGGGDGGIHAPSQINVLVSEDNVNFSNLATITNIVDSTGWIEQNFSVVSARYVRFEITRGGEWTMLGELVVYGLFECGNNITEQGEECDLTDLSGQDCVSRGFVSGTLSCSNNCFFNVSQCVPNITTNYYDGNTTNFSSVNDSSVNDMVLEKVGFGKIRFNQLIRFSRSVNLDNFTNITKNRIFINSSGLHELNVSATLTLTGLSLIEPIILRDGVPCSPPDCVIVDYDGENLTFNVSGFSEYTAGEAVSTNDDSSSGNGGGGGGSSSSSGKGDDKNNTNGTSNANNIGDSRENNSTGGESNVDVNDSNEIPRYVRKKELGSWVFIVAIFAVIGVIILIILTRKGGIVSEKGEE